MSVGRIEEERNSRHKKQDMTRMIAQFEEDSLVTAARKCRKIITHYSFRQLFERGDDDTEAVCGDDESTGKSTSL